tara:strand:- start:1004 stop:1240 length:237 start_codon:yes stop_codon:yes gene_type:complete
LIEKEEILNLRNIPCPLNIVKCKLALEKMSKGETLIVELDRGEPEIMVKQSLTKIGFEIKTVEYDENWIRFAISYDRN